MCLKKILVFGLIAAVLPAVAEEAADRKTATSLKYVTHELDTRQNKFGAEQNKAMEYTNAAGVVQKRAVTSDLDNGGTDSLPMVGGVNTKLNQKQDDIAAVNDHTAVTYTGTAGTIGQKGIYQTTGTYAEQRNDLIDAKTFNAALKNGLDSEFVCREDNRDPVSNLCWLYTIHNTYEESAEPYVSATGTGVQDGTPTPEHPIEPIFYRQGDMVLRKVGNYADSYDATTHKITRRVGVKVLNGTEWWATFSSPQEDYYRTYFYVPDIYAYANVSVGICSHFPYKWQWYENQITKEAFHNNVSIGSARNIFYFEFLKTRFTTLNIFKQWLAAQYAAGTPVTVYYPLATPVEEDWTETTYGENVYIPQNQ